MELELASTDGAMTRSKIRADVGVAIVAQTISRHLADANLKSKRPFRALPLTPEHPQLRLQWCQARSMWNVTDWQKVVFSDESRFVLGTDDNRVRMWRRPAYDSRSTLIVMRGTLTGQRYIDDIIRPHVGPFLNGLPGAIFQQDNARPHTARVAQDSLRHFQTIPWQARSPDLSPVEHV
ncbi:transposable element Tcb2 transposase [Trichonephila clavipes]|nr:transposable element Tcb2 transposase [Trichonephila clavipes]